MFGGTGMGFFAALLYWFPKMFGKMYNEKMAVLSWVPDLHRLQHALFQHAGSGLHGNAAAIFHAPAPVSFRARHCVDGRIYPGGSDWCSFFANLIVALFKGKKAEQNPWGGVTLEWQISISAAAGKLFRDPDDQRTSLYFQSGDFPMSRPAATPPVAHKETHKDYEGAKLGMWLFLFTEILLFGGLFILYSAYRARYPLEFHDGRPASQCRDRRCQHDHPAYQQPDGGVVDHGDTEGESQTVGLVPGGERSCWGLAFLVNKYIEWSGEIGRGLYPNSPVLLQRPKGIRYFSGSTTA